jgi:adenine-specific DNA-methyltransferase
MCTRDETFARIQNQLADTSVTQTSDNILIAGDSLERIKTIPDDSISLILTDPPYHATKKKNIYGDTKFKEDQEYLEWMEKYSIEWHRILKPNGSLFCFCASAMSARLEVMFSSRFNILSQIVWTKPNEPGFDGWKGKMKKESLRQWYPHSERIIFAEPAYEGNLHRSYFGDFLRNVRKQAGLSGHLLTELIGAYGKVNHGGAVSNWETGRNIPSREQYEKIVQVILSTGNVAFMPDYEDVIRVFSVNVTKEFTDVWTFPSVRPYREKHPAEKPLDMLKHAIESTTYVGDIILDCFAGSGSTAMASSATGRRCISIEIEEQWVQKVQERLESSAAVTNGQAQPQNIELQKIMSDHPNQMALFNGSK